MAAKQSSPTKLLGIALLIAGGGLGVWGFQKSEGLESQLSSAFTGSHTDNVMMLYIGAGICIVVGAILALRK